VRHTREGSIRRGAKAKTPRSNFERWDTRKTTRELRITWYYAARNFDGRIGVVSVGHPPVGPQNPVQSNTDAYLHTEQTFTVLEGDQTYYLTTKIDQHILIQNGQVTTSTVISVP
jgi:hypothetical protein